MLAAKDIYAFTDYRVFLKAYGDERRRTNPRWSYSQWAKKMHLGGTAVLTMILNGQRHPGPELSKKIIAYFKFNEREADYFLSLVGLQKSKRDPQSSISFLERLKKLSPKQDFRLLDFETFSAVSNWYYYAIREMTLLSDFDPAPEWIARRLQFRVQLRDVKKAWADLLHFDLIRQDDHGKFRPTHSQIDTNTDIASEAIKRFHEQTCNNAREAIRSVAVSDREFSAMTMTIRRDRLPEAKKFLRQFRREFCDLMEGPSGDAAYALNIQFFPLTKISNMKGKKK